jgi:hypothetical protein
MGSGNRKLGPGLAMGCGARDARSRRTGKKTREREREQTAQRRNRELGGTNGCSPRPWAGRAAGRQARKGAPWGRGHQSLPQSVLGEYTAHPCQAQREKQTWRPAYRKQGVRHGSTARLRKKRSARRGQGSLGTKPGSSHGRGTCRKDGRGWGRRQLAARAPWFLPQWRECIMEEEDCAPGRR